MLTGLTRGEHFYVGVAARDRYGNVSTPTISATWVPGAVTPPGAVSDLVITSTASNELNLTWSAPGNDGTAWAIPDGRFLVAYSTVAPSTGTLNPAAPAATWPGVQWVYISTSVQPGEWQRVRVAVPAGAGVWHAAVWTSDEWFGQNNWSGVSNIATAGTPELPDPIVRGWSVHGSTDEAVGSYLLVDLQNPAVNDLAWIRVYHATGGYARDAYVASSDTASSSRYVLPLPRLIPRTTYYCTAVAAAALGAQSAGVRFAVWIDADALAPKAPSEPILIATSTVASLPYGSAIVVSFIEPDRGQYRNADLAGYRVYASTWNPLPHAVGDDPVAVVTSSFVELLHLRQHTTYYISVSAYDPAGNASTSPVCVAFTRYDRVSPAPAQVLAASCTVMPDPADGLHAVVRTVWPADVDLDRSFLEVSSTAWFGVPVRATATAATPGGMHDELLTGLAVGATYHVRVTLSDWSGNISVSTTTLSPVLFRDSSEPLPPVGVSARVDGGIVQLAWLPVVAHARISDGVIVPFSGVGGAGPGLPTTFELYRYRIQCSSDPFHDVPWEDVAVLDAAATGYALPASGGYYRVVAEDATGNSGISWMVDEHGSAHVVADGAFVSFSPETSVTIARNGMYLSLQPRPAETVGGILSSFEASFGILDLAGGRIVWSSRYNSAGGDARVGVAYRRDGGDALIGGRRIPVDRLTRELAFFVYDGAGYIRTGAQDDPDRGVLHYLTRIVGRAQLRVVAAPESFAFIGVKPSMVTPSGSPGRNDAAFFIFNNPNRSEVRIAVFDARAVKVFETITREDSSVPGSYIRWDGTDGNGRIVQPGVYIYRIACEGIRRTGTIVVAR